MNYEDGMSDVWRDQREKAAMEALFMEIRSLPETTDCPPEERGW